MDTTSLWKKLTTSSSFPKLTDNIDVDVAIVGGGITGITAAYQLIQAGKKVAIIEANQIGGVTTSYSTGNLYIPVQPYYHVIKSKFNLEAAKAIAHARKLAIDYIENNVSKHNIACHFHRRPWFAYTNGEKSSLLEKEMEILKKLDVDIAYTKELPFPLEFKKAITIPAQARFNPYAYVIAMAQVLRDKNGSIFEHSPIINFEEKHVCRLTTAKAKITAKNVIFATHIPIGINSLQMFNAPYRSYVVAATLSDGQYPEGHVWHLDNHFYALCTHAISGHHPDTLMISGSHHKTGQGNHEDQHYQELEDFIRKHFKVADIIQRWSAQHYQAADKIPYIGLASSSAKHSYVATGYFADGLVYGTLAGVLLAETIVNNKNTLTDTLRSTRFTPLASLATLLKENANVFWQYMKDYPIFFDNDFKNLKAGEGKVVDIKREKCAVSRDENDKLHIVSAVCTHMKCIVNWNKVEKTWDCPCHGSRFTCQGKVIEGPAMTDLENKQTLL